MKIAASSGAGLFDPDPEVGEDCAQVWESPEPAPSPITPRLVGRFVSIAGFGVAAGALGIVVAAVGSGSGALGERIDAVRALAAFAAVVVCALGFAGWYAADRWLFDPLERLAAAATLAAQAPGRLGIWGRERRDAFGKIARAIERMQADRHEALARAAAAEARGRSHADTLAELARRVRSGFGAQLDADRAAAETQAGAPRIDLAAAAPALHQLRRGVLAQREIVAELVGAVRDRRPVPEPRLLQALAGAEVVVRAAQDCERRATDGAPAADGRSTKAAPTEARPRRRAAA